MTSPRVLLKVKLLKSRRNIQTLSSEDIVEGCTIEIFGTERERKKKREKEREREKRREEKRKRERKKKKRERDETEREKDREREREKRERERKTEKEREKERREREKERERDEKRDDLSEVSQTFLTFGSFIWIFFTSSPTFVPPVSTFFISFPAHGPPISISLTNFPKAPILQLLNHPSRSPSTDTAFVQFDLGKPRHLGLRPASARSCLPSAYHQQNVPPSMHVVNHNVSHLLTFLRSTHQIWALHPWLSCAFLHGVDTM